MHLSRLHLLDGLGLRRLARSLRQLRLQGSQLRLEVGRVAEAVLQLVVQLPVAQLQLQLNRLRHAELGRQVGYPVGLTACALEGFDCVHQDGELRRGVAQVVLQAFILARGQLLRLACSRVRLPRLAQRVLFFFRQLLHALGQGVDARGGVVRVRLSLTVLQPQPFARARCLGQLLPQSLLNLGVRGGKLVQLVRELGTCLHQQLFQVSNLLLEPLCHFFCCCFLRLPVCFARRQAGRQAG